MGKKNKKRNKGNQEGDAPAKSSAPTSAPECVKSALGLLSGDHVVGVLREIVVRAPAGSLSVVELENQFTSATGLQWMCVRKKLGKFPSFLKKQSMFTIADKVDVTPEERGKGSGLALPSDPEKLKTAEELLAAYESITGNAKAIAAGILKVDPNDIEIFKFNAKAFSGAVIPEVPRKEESEEDSDDFMNRAAEMIESQQAAAKPAAKEESEDSDDFMNRAAEMIESQQAAAAKEESEDSDDFMNRAAEMIETQQAAAKPAQAPKPAAKEESEDSDDFMNRAAEMIESQQATTKPAAKAASKQKGQQKGQNQKNQKGQKNQKAQKQGAQKNQKKQGGAKQGKKPAAAQGKPGTGTTSSIAYYYAARGVSMDAAPSSLASKPKYTVPVKQIKKLLSLVPKKETRLIEVLQLALKSDLEIIATEALTFLINHYSVSASTGTTTPAAGGDQKAQISAVLAVLPKDQKKLRAALELALTSSSKIVGDAALLILAETFGAKIVSGGSPSKAKVDPVADFQNNVRLCKKKQGNQKRPTSVVSRARGGRGGGAGEAAALVAENAALRRSLREQDPRTRMSIKDQNKLFLGSLDLVQPAATAACPCVAAASARTSGLPAGAESWGVDEVAAWAASVGISAPLCAVLQQQDIDGASLGVVTFEQLKADGFTTGMALRLVRAITGAVGAASGARSVAPAGAAAAAAPAASKGGKYSADSIKATIEARKEKAAEDKKAKVVSSGHYTGCKNDSLEAKDNKDCDCKDKAGAHLAGLQELSKASQPAPEKKKGKGKK